MINNNVRGCYWFDSITDMAIPPKNITYHSRIFPTMNAVRKGKWYLTEHGHDLYNLLNKHIVSLQNSDKRRGFI